METKYTHEEMIKLCDEARYEAIGWTYAFCCASLDDGINPREIEVPVILEKAKEELGF